MFGASLLKLVKFGFHFTGEEAAILIIGMIVAFVVSLIVIKFLMGYIKAQLYCVWMVPYSSWCDCAALWYRRASLNTF